MQRVLIGHIRDLRLNLTIIDEIRISLFIGQR